MSLRSNSLEMSQPSFPTTESCYRDRRFGEKGGACSEGGSPRSNFLTYDGRGVVCVCAYVALCSSFGFARMSARMLGFTHVHACFVVRLSSLLVSVGPPPFFPCLSLGCCRSPLSLVLFFPFFFSFLSSFSFSSFSSSPSCRLRWLSCFVSFVSTCLFVDGLASWYLTSLLAYVCSCVTFCLLSCSFVAFLFSLSFLRSSVPFLSLASAWGIAWSERQRRLSQWIQSYSFAFLSYLSWVSSLWNQGL